MLLRATKSQGNALLFHDGTTSVDFSYKIKVGCTMSACRFPTEKHECKLTLDLITHNASEVFLSPESSAPPGYVFRNPTHDLWTIKIGKPVTIMYNLLGYPGNWMTSMITRSILLERKPYYYYVNLIVPMVLISTITLAAVILPKESGEKVSLLITCFLSQIVYLDVLMVMFPKTSSYVPVMTIFTTGVLVLTTLHILLACLAAFLAMEAESEDDAYPSLFRKAYKSMRRLRLSKNNTRVFELKRKGRRTISVSNEDENDRNENEEGKPCSTVKKFETATPEDECSESVDLSHKRYKEVCAFLCFIFERVSFYVSLIFLIVFPLVLNFAKDVSSFCKT